MGTNLPRIFIIDDIFGSTLIDRRNLCRNFGLIDVTGDDSKPASIEKPIAEAVFCSGQIRRGKTVRNDIKTAIEVVRKGWESKDKRWSLILLDLRFVSGQIVDNEPEGQPGDDSFGLTILDTIHEQFPDVPIVIISSRDRSQVIEDCRTRGASDFIQRHEHGTDKLSPREILKAKISEHGLIEDNRELSDEKNRIVGKSISLLKALRAARRGATGKGNILILGETGTGKELFARYIHDMSTKSEGPYEVFHPFGTAETLQEDSLFGHLKGAFTGATSDKQGLFEISNRGTLFIDEIGDIPESLQLKLLRPLENRITARQGDNKEIPLDNQFVLATNKNLDEYSKTGKFKYDLLNRINAYPIKPPPLRECKEDIPLISEKLLEFVCKENNARWPRKILPETMELLKKHDWPDNVRGLRNVLERAVKDNKDSELVVPSDIRFDISTSDIAEASKPAIAALQSHPAGIDSLDILIESLKTFEFPADYSNITGKLPALQEAVAILLANYLLSALDATKKKKPGNLSELELNITGAASCMMGKQLKTPKAADVIKKVLQTDKTILKKILDKNPHLQSVYNDVLRLRPTNPKGPKKDKDDN